MSKLKTSKKTQRNSIQYKMGQVAAKLDKEQYSKHHVNKRPSLEQLQNRCPYKLSSGGEKQRKEWIRGYDEYIEENGFLELPSDESVRARV